MLHVAARGLEYLAQLLGLHLMAPLRCNEDGSSMEVLERMAAVQMFTTRAVGELDDQALHPARRPCRQGGCLVPSKRARVLRQPRLCVKSPTPASFDPGVHSAARDLVAEAGRLLGPTSPQTYVNRIPDLVVGADVLQQREGLLVHLLPNIFGEVGQEIQTPTQAVGLLCQRRPLPGPWPTCSMLHRT